MRVARGVAVTALPVLWLVAQGAQAHPLGAHGAGFAAGIAHPFLGSDHLAAMIAVGLWAAQLGGAARWRVPLTFIAMLAVGAGLAFAGMPFPAVQTGIAASLLVLGLLIGSAARVPESAGVLLIAGFALFHGHAHGAELPQAAGPFGYALGFITATAALHAFGLLAGVVLHARGAWLLRATGVVIAGSGLVLLAA